MAPVAFWGAKGHSGWYAAKRYRDSAGRQHPPWIGNSWSVAVRSGGPYVINPMLAARLPEIEDMYLDGQWQAVARALPSARTRDR
ncbi:hypothetical protein PO878_03940 [Iamia majanohamensis]|uniref:Uncharacterized protein n=1 Tax=Iamia majanohamensis TaxID=467976 RepID=A0AAE9YBB2_9ACTN|nr:hypothetical protein [Iamia majanohamensis]WCO67874.1 hypothetical protein PO878_03940 [Iamia majanohamensis]